MRPERIDGSAMDYEENVAWTAALATKAHGLGVAVEAELGKLAGEEDGLSVPEVEAKMTDPHQVWWWWNQCQPWLLGVASDNFSIGPCFS